MKIVFLDIDGVLNSIVYDRERTEEQGNIDETRLLLLKQIIDQTHARIVLSSSWRKHWDKTPSLRDAVGREIDNLFSKYGLFIFDKTPKSFNNDRASEIREWLAKNEFTGSFVILDDIAFGWGVDLQDHLVKTNARIGRGLEERHVHEAIQILNEKQGAIQ